MWDITQRAVSIATLFLLIAMISILLSNGKTSIETDNLTAKIEQYREDSKKLALNHLNYLETRLNRIQESQDIYQNTTSKTLSIIENRIKLLEEENKSLKTQGKIVNTNNNNAIINIPSVNQ